ncbi:hypothetical protein ACFQMM_02380 [Saliphagus sp. GCM10025308]
MIDDELADEIADMVGIDTYNSASYNSQYRASFTKEERRQIYEEITGEPGDELLRTELNHLIMEALGSELHSSYPYEFIRTDLKLIHKHLSEERSETQQ